MKAENLVGRRFGTWKVKALSTRRENGHIYWDCVCDCGTKTSVLGEGLRGGYSTGCFSCGRKKARKKIQKHISFRYRELAYNYNLSYDQVQTLLKLQEFKCAICHVKIDEKALVDHNHLCCNNNTRGQSQSCGKCVRGFLCRRCNAGLGMFKDSLKLLQNAISYLEKSQ